MPEFSSGYLITPRCITDLRKNSLFIGSGGGRGAGWVEDFWGDHTVLLGGQKRDLSSLTDCKGGTILLTANGGGELNILKSLMRGSSKSFHNTTKSPKLSRNIEKKMRRNIYYIGYAIHFSFVVTKCLGRCRCKVGYVLFNCRPTDCKLIKNS